MDSKKNTLIVFRELLQEHKQLSELKNLLGDHSALDPPDFHAELRSETK